MRIVILSALLAATASCAWPPPQAATPAAPPPPVAALPARPTPVALAPAMTPAPAPPIAAAVPAPAPPLVVAAVGAPAGMYVDYRPIPLIWFDRFNMPWGPPPGRLTLSNFTFDLADVQAVVTHAPDCAAGGDTPPLDFKLPRNSTWVIPAAPGADVCWRRHTVPPAGPAAAAASGWTPWSRVFTSSGRSIDAQL